MSDENEVVKPEEAMPEEVVTPSTEEATGVEVGTEPKPAE